MKGKTPQATPKMCVFRALTVAALVAWPAHAAWRARVDAKRRVYGAAYADGYLDGVQQRIYESGLSLPGTSAT